MIVRPARLALLLTAIFTAGCSREPTPTPASEPTVTVQLDVDPWVLQAIESTGPRAAIVAVFHPGRWAGAQARIAGLLAQLPGTSVTVDPAPQVLAILGVDLPALPTTGRDLDRPLILALAEPPHDAPIGTLAATTPLRALPGLRHQILVPASDPAALSTALVDALTSRGLVSRPVPERPGAIGFTLPDRAFAGEVQSLLIESHGGGDWLAVIPEADLVRLVVVRGGVYPADPARPRAPLLLPGAAERTSGVAMLASAQTAGALLRPQRLAALRSWMWAQQSALALVSVAADQLAEAERAGLRIMVGCELLHGDVAPEVEDWTLALAADDAALRLRLVTSLTPLGARIVDAGLGAAAAPLTLTRADTIGHGWLRFDGDAARGALGPSSPWPNQGDDLAVMMQDCGAWTALLGPAAPFGNAQRLPGTRPPGSITQLALTRLASGDVQGALAVHTPGPMDADARAGIPVLGELLGAGTEIHSEPEGSGERTRIGFGVDPRAVFGAPAPTTDLARLHLELAPVAAALASHAPDLAAALRPHARASLLAARTGQAVEVELVLGDAAPQLHDLGAYTWPPPADPAACSQDHARALHRLLQAADDPALTLAAATQQLQALEATLGCPTLAPLAPTLRRTGLQVLADAFADRSRLADARALLTAPCSAGDAPLCARLEALKAAIDPELPVVTTTCPDRFPGGPTLAVDSKGISLDGQRVADASALRSALLEQMVPRSELALDFDADLTLATLRPVLGALDGLRLHVSVRTADARLRRLPLAAVEYGLGEAAIVERSELDRYLDAYSLRIEREPVELRSSADDGEALRLDAELPAGARLRVLASDATTWGTVAAALARGCEDTRLVDPDGTIRRAITPPPPPVSK